MNSVPSTHSIEITVRKLKIKLIHDSCERRGENNKRSDVETSFSKMENQKDNIKRSTRAELNYESIRKVFTVEIAASARAMERLQIKSW